MRNQAKIYDPSFVIEPFEISDVGKVYPSALLSKITIELQKKILYIKNWRADMGMIFRNCRLQYLTHVNNLSH